MKDDGYVHRKTVVCVCVHREGVKDVPGSMQVTQARQAQCVRQPVWGVCIERVIVVV